VSSLLHVLKKLKTAPMYKLTVAVAALVVLSGCFYRYHIVDISGRNRPESAQDADRWFCSHSVGTVSNPTAEESEAANQRVMDCMKSHGWVWERDKEPRGSP
jgi:hypothetical protein